MSLDEIVAAALAHNPGLAASRGDLDTARRGIGGAQSLGVPKFALTGAYDFQHFPLRTADGLPCGIGTVEVDVLQSLDLETLMAESAALTRQVLGVEYCKVLELLPDGGTLLCGPARGGRAAWSSARQNRPDSGRTAGTR